MTSYILLGYQYSDFTIQAKDLLDDHKVDYEFKDVVEFIPHGNCYPPATLKLPSLRLADQPTSIIADGIESIKQWTKQQKR